MLKSLGEVGSCSKTITALSPPQPPLHQFFKMSSRIGVEFLGFFRVQLGVYSAPVGIPNCQALKPCSPMLIEELKHLLVPAVNAVAADARHINALLFITPSPFRGDGLKRIWRHKCIRVVGPVKLDGPFRLIKLFPALVPSHPAMEPLGIRQAVVH